MLCFPSLLAKANMHVTNGIPLGLLSPFLPFGTVNSVATRKAEGEVATKLVKPFGAVGYGISVLI
jgi:hypothetical protein